MSENPAKEAFNDLLTYLEQVQTRCEALFRFLLDNGTVSNEKLTPYLEQASKASDVRLRAARARIEHLFNAEQKAKPATESLAGGSENESQKAPPSQAEQSAEKEKPSEGQADTPRHDEQEPSEIKAGRETAGKTREPSESKEKEAA